MIREDSKSAEIIKPVLQGRNIKRYRHDWDKTKLWLIATFPSLRLNIDHYPAIKRYLLSFGKERLEQAGRTLPDGTKSRKKTTHAWYELQDTCAYHAEFEKEKIIYPNMTKFLPFIYDNRSMYTNQKCFIITGKDLKYLLGWLNSKIFRSIFRDSFPELQGGTRELSKIFFENIPVPMITQHNKKTSQTVEFMVDKILIAKEEDTSADTTVIEDEIDQLFYGLYALNREEIQLIEEKV